MNRYKLWLVAAVLALTVPVAWSTAGAWEFKMDGTFTWEYGIRGQMGEKGFFGDYNVDVGSGATTGPAAGFYAPVNFWVGGKFGDQLTSGSDASWQTQYMNTNVEIRMNPAVRIRGSYYIGEWPGAYAAGPQATEYLNNRYPGIQRSFSPGYWNTLWLSAQLPWGEVALGKRPSNFGCGFFWNGSENRSSESLALAVPYGPLRFVVSFYPSRRGSVTTPTATTGYYDIDIDKNNGRLWDAVLPQVIYRDGPLETGFLFNWVRYLQGPEGITATPATRTTNQWNTDLEQVYGGAYVKYTNGMFFLNSEVDWDHVIQRYRQKNAAGVAIPNPAVATAQQPQTAANSGSSDRYREHWRFMVELGGIAGPTKMSAMYAWLSGQDRRAGERIDRTGLSADPQLSTGANFGQNVVLGRSITSANTGLFRPYSYLMVGGYGLGTHFNSDTNEGSVEDASIYAARIDYAVAANLNVFGSFMWADRASSSGYAMGCINPIAATAGATPPRVVIDNDRIMNPGARGSVHVPNIPDQNLGYEITAGVDWKLLENLTLNSTFAYWQPGKWFSYACVDKSIVGWGNAALTTAGNWGVNPGRTIAPVYGLEIKVVGDF